MKLENIERAELLFSCVRSINHTIEMIEKGKALLGLKFHNEEEYRYIDKAPFQPEVTTRIIPFLKEEKERILKEIEEL